MSTNGRLRSESLASCRPCGQAESLGISQESLSGSAGTRKDAQQQVFSPNGPPRVALGQVDHVLGLLGTNKREQQVLGTNKREKHVLWAANKGWCKSPRKGSAKSLSTGPQGSEWQHKAAQCRSC